MSFLWSLVCDSPTNMSWYCLSPADDDPADGTIDDVDCISTSIVNGEDVCDYTHTTIDECLDQEVCPDVGDVNGDSAWNVLDIVLLANCVLNDDCANEKYKFNLSILDSY